MFTSTKTRFMAYRNSRIVVVVYVFVSSISSSERTFSVFFVYKTKRHKTTSNNIRPEMYACAYTHTSTDFSLALLLTFVPTTTRHINRFSPLSPSSLSRGRPLCTSQRNDIAHLPKFEGSTLLPFEEMWVEKCHRTAIVDHVSHVCIPLPLQVCTMYAF